MVRISTVCVLFASIAGLVSAANPDDMELPSIRLCRDAGNKFRNWKRLQLLSDLSKKSKDKPMQDAFSLLAQKANVEFIQANKLADDAMEADMKAVKKAQCSIIHKYDEKCEELRKQRDNRILSYEWQVEQEDNFNREYSPYATMIMVIMSECDAIMDIDTPRRTVREKSRSTIKKATDKARSMFRKLIIGNADNTKERQ